MSDQQPKPEPPPQPAPAPRERLELDQPGVDWCTKNQKPRGGERR